MKTGLDFPVNGGAFVSLDWATIPNRTLMTAIFDVFIKSDSGYRAWWWFHHNGTTNFNSDEWDDGDYNVGFHPHPSGPGTVTLEGAANATDNGNPNQFMEIAGAGDAADWIATAGSSTVYQMNALFGTWVPMAFAIEVIDVSGTDYIEYTLYVDRTDMSKKIVHRQLLSDLSADNGSPASPLFSLGGSKWRVAQLDENAGGIFRNLQLYSGVRLSESDIVTEGNGTNPTTPATTDGQTYVHYRKLDPTPDDVADDSSAGNDPTWFNSNRPALWTDAITTNALSFPTNADFLTRVSNLLDFNSAYTVLAYVYLESVGDFAHFWSAAVGPEGSGDYANSDFMGHSNDNPASSRMGAVFGSGTYPTGATLPATTWLPLWLVRTATDALALYLDDSATPLITDSQDVDGRSAAGVEILSRLNAAYGVRGRIAWVMQWNRALSNAERAAQVWKGYVAVSDGLHEYWPFPDDTDRLVGALNGYTWTENGDVGNAQGPLLDSGLEEITADALASLPPPDGLASIEVSTSAAALGTLPQPQGLAAAQNPVEVSGLSALPQPEGAAALATTASATALATLPQPESAAAIAVNIQAVGLTNLPQPEGVALAAVASTALGLATLPQPEGFTALRVDAYAAALASLPQPEGLAAAGVGQTATALSALPQVEGAAVIQVPIDATAIASLPDLEGVAAVSVAVDAAALSALPQPEGVAAAAVAIEAACLAALPEIQGLAFVENGGDIIGAALSSLPQVEGVAVLGSSVSAAVLSSLPQPEGLAAVEVTVTAASIGSLPQPEGVVAIQVPVGAASLSSLPQIEGLASITVDSVSVSATALSTLPQLEGLATAVPVQAAQALATLPGPEGRAVGVVASTAAALASLPQPEAAIVLQNPIPAAALSSLPALECMAAAVVHQAAVGMASLPSPQGAVVAQVTVAVAALAALPDLEGLAILEVEPANTVSALASLPQPECRAQAQAVVTGFALATLPALSAMGSVQVEDLAPPFRYVLPSQFITGIEVEDGFE